ncbi:hypothetical protein Tco_0014822 [Tanacetum coccineum]
MPTEMELTLEQTQQGVSYEVSVSIEGVEKKKEIVKDNRNQCFVTNWKRNNGFADSYESRTSVPGDGSKVKEFLIAFKTLDVSQEPLSKVTRD